MPHFGEQIKRIVGKVMKEGGKKTFVRGCRRQDLLGRKAEGVGMAGFPRCKEEMGDTHI